MEWNNDLNERRFALIDKEIRGSITPAEKLELAGLTTIMRSHVEEETIQPVSGARALHGKLLEIASKGQSD